MYLYELHGRFAEVKTTAWEWPELHVEHWLTSTEHFTYLIMIIITPCAYTGVK